METMFTTVSTESLVGVIDKVWSWPALYHLLRGMHY